MGKNFQIVGDLGRVVAEFDAAAAAERFAANPQLIALHGRMTVVQTPPTQHQLSLIRVPEPTVEAEMTREDAPHSAAV